MAPRVALRRVENFSGQIIANERDSSGLGITRSFAARTICIFAQSSTRSKASHCPRSLEVRSPFLDHELVELCATLPIVRGTSMRVVGKSDVAGARSRPLPPQEVLDAPKRGFSVPLADGWRGNARQQVRDGVLPLHRALTPFLDETVAASLIEEHQSGTRQSRAASLESFGCSTNGPEHSCLAEMRRCTSSQSMPVTSQSLLSSCDRSSSMRGGSFAFFFRKFWADCPFATYLIVNELEVRSATIRALRVGKDQGWASNMQPCAGANRHAPTSSTSRRTTSSPLEVQRDQLCQRHRPRQATRTPRRSASAIFRFSSRSLAVATSASVLFGMNRKGARALQAALWKRDVFSSLLRPAESAWDMEARGNERTRAAANFVVCAAGFGPISLSDVGNRPRPLDTGGEGALSRARFSARPLVPLAPTRDKARASIPTGH